MNIIFVFLLFGVASASDCSTCTLLRLKNDTVVSVWKNLHYREKYRDLVSLGFVNDVNKYAIVYFAWMFNSYHAERYRAAFDLIPKRYHGNFLWAANSPAEYTLLRQVFPDSGVVFSPYTALLNEDVFGLPEPHERPDEPLCLVNAQGQIFKNHALSKNIPHKVFVTYNVDKSVNLSQLNPLEVHDSIDHIRLAAQLARADYGAILSTEEGACRASLEYLYAGLPVLSTYGVGGREVRFSPALRCGKS